MRCSDRRAQRRHCAGTMSYCVRGQGAMRFWFSRRDMPRYRTHSGDEQMSLEEEWRMAGGFVGMVKPTTQGSGSHDALVRMLPPSVRTHTVYCGIKDGTVEEFEAVMPQYERGVAEAAGAQGRPHPSGRHAAVHDPRLCRRAAHRRGLGGQVRHPGLHLGHEPDPRHEGAGRQAHRRRRLRFHHRADWSSNISAMPASTSSPSRRSRRRGRRSAFSPTGR